MNQPQSVEPTPGIAQYYVWAMNGKGNSRRLHGPSTTLVGWCGSVCTGHWHNLFGPATNDAKWRAGDIRDQVRAFIKPRRK